MHHQQRSLEIDLEAGYAKAESEGYTQKLVIGPVARYSDSQLLSTARPFSIENQEIVIYQYPCDIHDTAAMIVANFCSDELNCLVLNDSDFQIKFVWRNAEFSGLSDPFNCSKLKGKRPDAAICLEVIQPIWRRRHEPIAVEVAFRQESFVKLLHEGCHLLSNNSDVLIVILVFLIENIEQADVEGIRVIVLERMGPLVSDLNSAPELECFESPWPLNANLDNIQKADLLRLPGQLIYDRTVTRRNFDSLPLNDAINLSLLNIENWYGFDLFSQKRARIPTRRLFSNIFSTIDGLKHRGLYYK